MELLKELEEGMLDSSIYPLDELFSIETPERTQLLMGPRNEYKSPLDRSSYDSGYIKVHEMLAGTPNEK